MIHVGERVSHFKTGRSGLVHFVGRARYVILFDDGKEEWRRKNVFVKEADFDAWYDADQWDFFVPWWDLFDP